jgi:hypothetical protein
MVEWSARLGRLNMNTREKSESRELSVQEARELQDSELEAVSGGASMVDYVILTGAVLAIAVAKRLSS